MYDAGSVLLELINSGEEWAAQVLWQLLQLDGAARQELDAVAARALRRPPLARCPELLHALAMGLATSNKASAKDGGARPVHQRHAQPRRHHVLTPLTLHTSQATAAWLERTCCSWPR